ncbi:MAG: AMP-binding protein [Sphingomonadaceae bacterium]
MQHALGIVMERMVAPLPAILFERAQADPARPFLQSVEGEHASFGAFMHLVGQYMAALSALEVRAGSRVAALVPQSIDAQAVWQAIAWMRAWEIPINNEFHGRMLAYVLNDSKAEVLVVADAYLSVVEDIRAELPHLREILAIGEGAGGAAGIVRFDSVITPDPAIRRRPELLDEDVATVIYTSGTTGPSKGVLVPWGEFYTGIDIYGCRGDGSDALYTPFPTNHLSGKVPIFDMAALAGRAVLRRRFSTSEFWKDVRAHGCTGTILLGGTAMFLNNQPPSDLDRDHSMHTVVMVPVMDEYREFERRFGLSVMTIYGMSECGFPFMSPPDGLTNAASCGRLRDGWHVRIVDSDGRDVPTGEVGELAVRCDQPHALMLGYLDRPEATAEAMRGGWFHTGDAFRADADGNYYFVDRIKDAIRRRGENISSFEVESLVARFPGIAECAAVSVPSETGEDEIKIVFTTTGDPVVDILALAQFCRRAMPAFMVPRYFERRESLPYTPTNKVKKAALRADGIVGCWDRAVHDRR